MPRTYQRIIKVYTFDELSERAKQRAKDDHAEMFGYSWSEEALASLQALAMYFGGKLVDWEIDWWATSHSSASFHMPDTVPDAEANGIEGYDAYAGDYGEITYAEIERRLHALGAYNQETFKGHGECKLTGYASDEDAIDGFRKAWMNGERDLDKCMRAAFRTWLQACQSDAEDQYSDETFSEMCEANGYEFFENGELA